MSSPSRRRLLSGCLALVGLTGCASVSPTTPVGYHLRNYTEEPQHVTVVVDSPAGEAERTHSLDPVDDGVPDVIVERDVTTAIRGREYTVVLRLDGERVGRHVATADCTDGDDPPGEQFDVDLGWGKQGAHRSHPNVDIHDPQC